MNSKNDFQSAERGNVSKVLLKDQFFGKEVPFVDQLQGLDGSLVGSEYGEIRDHGARQRFGAPLLQFFTFWGWRACGIANLAMILTSEFGKSPTLYELVCEGLRLNGYAFRNRYGKTDIGWRYRTLCQLLERRNLRTREIHHLDFKRVAKWVKKGNYVIASVRSPRGGHLVLITGFLQGPGVPRVIINDPYTFGGQGGAGLIWDEDEFQRNSLERGIVVWARASCKDGKAGAFDGRPGSSANGTGKSNGSGM